MDTNQQAQLDGSVAQLRAAAEHLTAPAELDGELDGATALTVEVRHGDDAWAEVTAVGGGPDRPLSSIDGQLSAAAETAALVAAKVAALVGDVGSAPSRRTITPTT